jgi:hypothetical protein
VSRRYSLHIQYSAANQVKGKQTPEFKLNQKLRRAVIEDFPVPEDFAILDPRALSKSLKPYIDEAWQSYEKPFLEDNIWKYKDNYTDLEPLEIDLKFVKKADPGKAGWYVQNIM